MLTEAQRDDVLMTVYLFGRHHRDPGQLLAVAEQQGAGDSVGEFQGVVAEEAGDQCPALVGVGGRSGGSPEGWHEQRGAVVVFGGPAEEVPDRVAGGPLGKPGVDVALAALGQRDAGVVEPTRRSEIPAVMHPLAELPTRPCLAPSPRGSVAVIWRTRRDLVGGTSRTVARDWLEEEGR